MKRVLIVLAVALSLALLVSGCASEPQASASATDQATSSATVEATEQSTAAATQTATPEEEASPSASQQPAEMHSAYEFKVGDETYEGVLLTDFSVGEVNTTSSFGTYEFYEGILSAYTGGVLADSYENYSGDDLATADYSEVTYFGIKVMNNQGANVLFGLQGAYDDTNFFLGREGDTILLAGDDGTLSAASGGDSSGRWCLTLPAGFSGYVLIPATRLYNAPNMDDGEQWVTVRSPLQRLGFHVSGAGAESVDIFDMFTFNGELPEAE